MKIEKRCFGATENGEKVHLYSLTNAGGVKLTVTNLGGRMVNLLLPDREGHMDDVIMGFDSLEDYLVRNPYFGAVVGRCANRIRNASYEWNGKKIELDQNAFPHHLHGGSGGFDKRIWEAEVKEGKMLRLSLFSPDGDQGYPGNLWTDVTYSLTDENELVMEYEARTDADTVVNLTNHCYYNLAGHQNGNVLKHILYLNADYVTETDEENIPTGAVMAVADTPLDFRVPQEIGSRMKEKFPCLQRSDGYDVNYILNRKTEKDLERFCFVYEPTSGRTMEGYTTFPAVQFYTGNNIKGDFTFVGKGGYRYPQYCGFCLETQFYPNSPNCPQFPSVILKKGDIYHHKTVFRFGTR